MSKTAELKNLLEEHKDKRVVVIGTTGTGKSTFVEQIENAQDMDELLFPKLTREEAAYVMQTPVTDEINETMTRLARERITVEPGKPIFTTVVLDCDILVELTITDGLLRERTGKRGIRFEDAKQMQQYIRRAIRNSGIPTISFLVG